MSEVTIEQLQAEVAELKRDNAALWQAINSIRHRPPLDVGRLDRVMQDRYQVKPVLAQR